MSQNPTQAEGTTIGIEATSQAAEQTPATTQQPQEYMLWVDPSTQQWAMHPYYLNILLNQHNII